MKYLLVAFDGFDRRILESRSIHVERLRKMVKALPAGATWYISAPDGRTMESN